MLVGEGEDGVRLVETAMATAEVSACQDAAGARKSSRRALVSAGLDLLARREPGSLRRRRELSRPEAASKTTIWRRRVCHWPNLSR